MRTPISPQVCPRGGVTYTEPLTGVTLHASCINGVITKAVKHRASNGIACAAGWLDGFHDEICRQNPHIPCRDVFTGDHPVVLEGRAAWKALHDYAMAYPESPSPSDVEAATAWLAGWRTTIPASGGCKCRNHWAEIEARHPMDLSSRRAFYNSTVVGHDAVNARLGKPLQAAAFLLP